LVRERDLGRVFSSDAGVVTERDPDSVRGPDVSFYSYEKLPKGPLTRSYPAVPPDAVFEVLSPHDRWPKVHGKVAEYLNLGIRLVAVLDPEREEISVYTESDPVRVLSASDELVIPVGQGDLRVPVQGFFE
jgi:Uma2 family endonuclease